MWFPEAPMEVISMDMAQDSLGLLRAVPCWHARLEALERVSDVVAMVRDYLAWLSPDEIGRLPESCRSVRVKAEDDIDYWTWRLSEARGDAGESMDADLAHEVFTHLLHAMLRIAQIHRDRARAAALTV